MTAIQAEHLPDFAAPKYGDLRHRVRGEDPVMRLEIACLYFQHGKSQEFIAGFFGVSQQAISKHVTAIRKAMAHLPRHKFIDQLN